VTLTEEPFVNPLAEFDTAVELFRTASIDTNAFLAQGHEVRPLLSYRAGVAGADVADCCRGLREAHVAAVVESTVRTAYAGTAPHLISPDELSSMGGDINKIGDLLKARFTPDAQAESLRYLKQMGEMMRASIPVTRNLQLAYKSAFYFLRVYHDVLYQMLNNLRGERKDTGTMKTALRSTNPVGQTLRAAVPGYLEWFDAMRDRRNLIKEGADFSIVGPDVNLGIGFTSYDEKTRGITVGGWEHAIRLGDVSAALDQSRSVADFVRGEAEAMRG
jgi:hypothetical protein